MDPSFRFPPEQLRALAELSRAGMTTLYLAGGTAVAAHLHHRVSNDLDLFSFEPEADLDALTQAVLSHLSPSQVVSQSVAATSIRAGALAVDIVRYPYPLLEPPSELLSNFPTAGLLDLAAMKMAAIARRGLRRDFWDLFEIATRSDVDLVAACHGYRKRYGVAQADLYHVLLSLTFFADAESEQVMPRGLTVTKWTTIKDFFREHAPPLIKKLARQTQGEKER